jgi:cell division protease FtsH
VQVEMNTGIEKDFVIKPTISNVTFKDVAGISEVKEELTEIVDFLKNPEKYKSFGIKLPKGVLLIGPPGVGKTLIAKALAGEAGVPFFYQSGSSFVQMYVGVGAKRVRDLFSKAKASAPSIIFIDEIDAIGKARGNLRNDEREATLNQLLTEMDGFEGSEGVIVIGATNKVELLDEALLRPGRFDRRVFVELPGLNDRIEILKVHLRGKPFKGNLENIAKMTVGFSGAALASLVNEASIHALKQGKKYIEESDFYAVKDKVLIGKKRLQTYNPKEKEILSFYQAAKAVVAEWLGVEFERISLVKDDFKEEDKEIISKTEIMNKIMVYLAGRIAVEVKYREKFSNAHMDIKKAKDLAVKMVKDYAMGDSSRR